MMRISDTVKHLIIINVLMFIGTLFVGKGVLFYDLFAMHFPANESFQPWQIITHMFMHGSFEHLFFNMLLLYFFGTSLELTIEKKKFLFVYISAGLGAILLTFLIDFFKYNMYINSLIESGFYKEELLKTLNSGMYNTGWERAIGVEKVKSLSRVFNTISYGASGAVTGVLAAFAFLYPNKEVFLIFPPIPIKIKYLAVGMIGSDFISGLLTGTPLLANSNVGYFAHVGGALTGLLIIWYWKKKSV